MPPAANQMVRFSAAVRHDSTEARVIVIPAPIPYALWCAAVDSWKRGTVVVIDHYFETGMLAGTGALWVWGSGWGALVTFPSSKACWWWGGWGRDEVCSLRLIGRPFAACFLYDVKHAAHLSHISFTRMTSFRWFLEEAAASILQYTVRTAFLILSLPRVINIKFLLQPHQKYNSHSVKYLAFQSLLRGKMIILLQILDSIGDYTQTSATRILKTGKYLLPID